MSVALSSNPLEYPGFTGKSHSEVFTTMPPQPTVKKPGQLPPEKVREYFEQGFTAVEGFFTEEELEPVRQSFNDIVEEITQKLYKAGKIQSLYEEYGLEKRLMMVEKEWPGAACLLLKRGKLTPAFQQHFQNEKLLNAIEQLIGPEIGASPIWQPRPKIPGNAETDVPWHQDSAYFDLESYQTLIATAWTAFVDATEENGCLEFFRGGHKKGMVGVHKCCENFYLMLDEEELVSRFGANPETDFAKCPLKAGGVIFFNNMIPHRSVPNVTDKIRWGMDFRFQSPLKPWGFYGTLSGILLRSPSKPDHKPDWNFLCDQDRYDVVIEDNMKAHTKTAIKAVDEFDATLTGPFMDYWPIVAHSKHTRAFLEEKRLKELEEAEKAKK